MQGSILIPLQLSGATPGHLMQTLLLLLQLQCTLLLKVEAPDRAAAPLTDEQFEAQPGERAG